MIALLTGHIAAKSPNELIVNVQGVGYSVATTLTTFDKLPEVESEVTLHIHTHVREDNISLYGFLTREEKELFTKLLKVGGVGPKVALSILSGVPADDFVDAVMGEDLARLNAIPGVGRKTAERIILDLKDKLTGIGMTIPSKDGGSLKSNIYDDAVSALINLGFNKSSAEKVLGKIGVANNNDLSTVIRSALKELSNI